MMRTRALIAAHVSGLIGLLAFAAAETINFGPEIALVAYCAAMILGRPRGKGAAPAWVRAMITLMALAVMALEIFTYSLNDATETVSVVTRFICWLAVVKALEPRTPRNTAQLILIGVMLSVGSTLVSVSLVMGLLVAVQLVSSLYGIMVYQVWEAEREAEDAGSPPDLEPIGVLGGDLRRVLGIVMAVAAVGAVVVFVFFPRGVAGSAIGQWSQSAGGASTTDFNDEIQLGVSGVVSPSPAVAMEVEIIDQGRPPRPSDSFLLRGAVLDTYDRQSGTWRSAPASGRQVSMAEIRQPTERDLRDFVVQRITLRDKEAEHLFAVYGARKISIHNSGGQFQREAEPKFHQVTLELTERTRKGYLRYEVYSDPDYVILERFLPRYDEGESRVADTFVGTPIEEFARDIMERAGYERSFEEAFTADDERIARTFLANLSREPYSYTLDLEAPAAGVDPIEYFLFESQRGHCEYFASAMAAMCQSVGINARVITGFVAAEKTGESTFVVRRSHAHAWTEVEVSPGEWVTLDPSPSAELTPYHRREGWLASLRRVADRIDSIWVEYVVGFDSQRQERVLDPAVEAIGDGGGPRQPSEQTREMHELMLAAFGAVVGLLLIGEGSRRVWLTWRGRQRAAEASVARFAGRDDAPLRAQQAAFYDRLLEMLRGAGAGKPAWRTPLAHVRTDVPAEVSGPAGELVNLYYDLRYGGRLLSEAELVEARRMLETVEAALDDRATRGEPVSA